MTRQPHLVVFHLPGPQWHLGAPFFEQDGVMQHVEHYRVMLEAGKLLMGGPFLDEQGGGMMIARPDVDAAELAAFAAQDPTVQSGLPSGVLRPWFVGMSAVESAVA